MQNTIEKILKENKDLLKLIAETLLEEETITKEQIDYLVENGKMPEEDENNLEAMSVTKLRELAKEKGVKNYSKLTKAEIGANVKNIHSAYKNCPNIQGNVYLHYDSMSLSNLTNCFYGRNNSSMLNIFVP